ncbi:hypothetical protein CALVIDRAFT_539430 [Calocera viscosa TUFC12733]|uniref:PLAT domain-containing protein n=1 Tax=Calocera viscosa (strain TUFC12733) TaxID=1330018 RepID=A0A167JY08_CALVF|nr:hypothetical protein CALVIDRAFT_539430 [Calocera viscosa TUFC12733]
MSDYPFACDNWVSADNLPDIPHVIASARALLESTPGWKKGKRHHRVVSTLSKRTPGSAGSASAASSKTDSKPPGWHVRVSEHSKADGVSFADLWWALGVDHSVHESEYVPDLKEATRLRVFEQGTVEAWALYYTFPPPLSPRTFTVLVILSPPSPATSGTGSEKEALIISLPYAPSASEEQKLRKSVRGKYCSIERIRELAEGEGRTEWRMAVQSSAAGLIPGWVQEVSVPGKISDDVPFVLKWLKTHPAPAEPVPVPEAEPVLIA